MKDFIIYGLASCFFLFKEIVVALYHEDYKAEWLS